VDEAAGTENEKMGKIFTGFRQSNTQVKGEKLVKTCKSSAKVRQNSTKSCKSWQKFDKNRKKNGRFSQIHA